MQIGGFRKMGLMKYLEELFNKNLNVRDYFRFKFYDVVLVVGLFLLLFFALFGFYMFTEIVFKGKLLY